MRATELELDALGGDVRGDREKPVQASREVAGRCGDAPLSGVARIVYETAAGRRSVEGPSVMLTIGAEGVTTVNYFAVDKGGNVEPAKTIVVRIARPVQPQPQPQPQPNRTRAVWVRRSAAQGQDAARCTPVRDEGALPDREGRSASFGPAARTRLPSAPSAR